jgi:hypothetical protein
MTNQSPCIGVCVLKDGVCIGCGRTIAEIFQAGVEAGFSLPESTPPEIEEED